MYRTIAGLLVVVAFVRVTEGDTEMTHFVDIVAQKLEDHLRGVHLEDKITYAECEAAFDEFEQWDEDMLNNNVRRGPLSIARNYLCEFMDQPMKANWDKYETNEQMAKEFVEKLESSYRKARSSYTYRTPLQCGAGIRRGAKTCALVDALTGKKGQLTQQMLDEFSNEVQETFYEMKAIYEDDDIHQNLDKWLELVNFLYTPETHVCAYGLASLMSEESAKKLEQGDPEEIQKYMNVYKSELANFVYPE